MEEYGSSSTSAIANASAAFLRSCRAGSRFSFSTTSFILDNNRPRILILFQRCISHRTSIRSFHAASLDRTSSVRNPPKDELPRIVRGDPGGSPLRLCLSLPQLLHLNFEIFVPGL